MQTRIRKWGNGLGVRIPKSLAQQLGIEAGCNIDLSVEDGQLIVRPRRSPKYELKQLLQSVTAENVHREIEIGEPVGREAR